MLEVASVLRSCEKEAKTGGDSRFVDCVDSNVELCALTRGRGSSNALRLLLKRASTLAVAFGLYPAGRFAPTRLNPGDHPTRDSVMPDPVASLSRSQLMSAFNVWLRDAGLSFEDVLLANPPNLDQVNDVPSRYGRFLFVEGKPYYHFSETINSVSAKRPMLRCS